MRPWFDQDSDWLCESAPKVRVCEHAGCTGEGTYRAPFSPQQMTRFRWFCLEHVRAYNASWDFAKGLQPDEIEQMIRFDTIWQRETRPLGDWRRKEALLRAQASRLADEKPGGNSAHRGEQAQRPRQTPQVVAALAMLELDVLPSAALLQKHYRKLVKQYHPDAHGGAKEAEDRLKAINLAYATLKEFLR